jgi:hypothetical protein
MQLQVTDYLCWERAQPENSANFFPGWEPCPIEDWSEPQQLKNCLPQWFRNLPANLKNLNFSESVPDQEMLHQHGHRSAKLCLGLRGIRTVGWTIPLTHDLTAPATYPGHNGNVGRKETMLHPAMLTGSGFDQLREDGSYEWEIRIISFPWRARMAPGWRLMITSHPLTWSKDWFCFSGCVDANYRHDGTNIGSFWNFDYTMDLSQNYYNIELVIAIRSEAKNTITIPKETCLFSMVPLYDPDYQPTEFKEFPNFNNSSYRA